MENVSPKESPKVRGAKRNIALVLLRNPEGLTLSQIKEELAKVPYFVSANTITTTVCVMHKQGFLVSAGSERCGHCGSIKLRRKLTTKGKEYATAA